MEEFTLCSGGGEGKCVAGMGNYTGQPRGRCIRVKYLLNSEMCSLMWRLFMCLSLFGMLALINFNIHQLYECLGKPDNSYLKVPGANCSAQLFKDDLQLRVEVCHSNGPPSIALYVDGSVLRVYSMSESVALVDWLRRCGGNGDVRSACHLYSNGDPACPYYAYSHSPPIYHLC